MRDRPEGRPEADNNGGGGGEIQSPAGEVPVWVLSGDGIRAVVTVRCSPTPAGTPPPPCLVCCFVYLFIFGVETETR